MKVNNLERRSTFEELKAGDVFGSCSTGVIYMKVNPFYGTNAVNVETGVHEAFNASAPVTPYLVAELNLMPG